MRERARAVNPRRPAWSRAQDAADAQTDASAADEAEAPAGPKLSGKLAADLAQERTRAVGLALARDPATARLYGDWLLVRNVLIGLRLSASRSTLRFGAATYPPAGVKIDNDPEALESAHGVVERGLCEHEAGLLLYWTQFGFKGFATLDAGARDRLAAWAVSRTLEPAMAIGLGDPARAAVEAAVLPDLRAVWRPDARLLRRLTKPGLLRLLRDDLGLPAKADAWAKEKKSALVEKVAALFASAPVTLGAEARTALDSWCPPGMQTVAPVEADTADAPASDDDPEPAAA